MYIPSEMELVCPGRIVQILFPPRVHTSWSNFTLPPDFKALPLDRGFQLKTLGPYLIPFIRRDFTLEIVPHSTC